MERIIGLVGQLHEKDDEQARTDFDRNLGAATASGTIGFAGFAAAEALQKAGHGTAASAALKLGIAAMAPYALFGIKAWKTANDLRKMAYLKTYPKARAFAANLKDRDLRLWATHAATARKRTMDPELEAWATAILHATVEELKERGLV